MTLKRREELNYVLKLILTLAIATVTAHPIVASQETDVMTPGRQFIDAFNKGDVKTIQVACADQTVIIDDFPPHEWRGSESASKWFRDLTAFGKNNGMSDAFVALDEPSKLQVTGAQAYAVVPIKLKYNERGQVVNRTGSMTLALQKSGDDWQIAALAWTWGEN